MNGSWGHFASEISQKRQILYDLIKKWNLNHEHIETEYRKVASKGWGLDGRGMGGSGDVGQRVYIFRYKMNKFWGSNV